MARKRKKAKKRTVRRKRILYWGLLVLAAGIILIGLFVLSIYIGMFGKLPESEEIIGIKQDNASLVYAADGTLMGKYYVVNRQSITNKSISPFVRQALIATEDNRFFEHHGIDMISLGRVLFKSILSI